MKNIICQLIILLLLCTHSYAKEGYKIILNNPDSYGKSYILSIYKWGEKLGIDTVKANKANKIIFSNYHQLLAGQYIIEESLGGNTTKLIEFMASPKTIKQAENSIYNITTLGISQEKGSTENLIYTKFQNLINTGWKQFKTPAELNDTINSIIKKAEQQCKGSILEIMLNNTLFPPASPQEIVENFPFYDSLIINTSFGKAKIRQYLKAIELNPNDTIINLINNIISFKSTDNKQISNKVSQHLQSLIASTAFDYFYNSNIMGQEGIAVKIAQNWFLNNKLKWPNKDGIFMLKTFVGLNKNSLIGMPAPELNLIDTLGNTVSLNTLQGDYTIIYFYTDDCHTCKIETPKLVNFVNEYKGGVINVYAVYTQENINNWKAYINREFILYNAFVNWVNVYDPQFESGFHLLYNVISTPQMFLLDKDKIIIGRNLKTNSLEELLNAKAKKTDDLHKFFNNFFTNLGNLDSITVNMGIDAFYKKSADNPQLFREIFKELYNFLRYSPNYILQQGAVYLGNNYILKKEELWNNQNFIEQVKKSIEIFNMNPLGGKAANLSLENINGSPIELYDIKNEYKVLFFYKINCGICSVVSKELQKLYDTYKSINNIDIEFVAINTGKEYKEWIKHVASNGFLWQETWGGDRADEIYQKYYLESVPSIYLLKNNIVIAKDINELDLKELLNTIIKNKH
ncbi:MAG: redoxin domain-containing protein [Bacteroidales bacterium]